MPSVIIASHTMPDILTPILLIVLACTSIPILVCASLGVGLESTLFHWQRILWILLGGVAGLLTLCLAATVMISLGQFFGPIGAIVGLVVAGWAGCRCAYGVGHFARQAGPPMTTLTESSLEDPAVEPRDETTMETFNPYQAPRA